MTVNLPTLNIEHLHGPEEIPYGEAELLVLCLVRDGRPWIKAFVEHYSALGAKHIVFLDNDSSDGTVAAASRYDNVTVLQTKLPFKDGQLLMRQYLIARFGKDRWSLCVDIDELFDYPYSDVIGLGSLLGYLDSKSYTAVAAYMLDMIPNKPLAGRTGEPEELSKEQHTFYDLSGLRRRSIKEHPHFSGNRLESNEIEWIRGGIRDTLFRVAPTLTKFPLVFSNGRVMPMEGSPHGVANARIADLSCVLFHYKFLSYFREQVARAVREENYWNNSAQYKQYLAVLGRNTSLTLKQDTSKEIASVNDLLEDQFLVVSDAYVRWVNIEEERSVLGEAQSGEPHVPAEAFLRANQRDRAKTLRIQRLERQLRDRNRRIRRSKRKQQRLKLRVRSLKQRLKGMEASRVWKLAGVMRGITARMWGS